MIKKLLTVLFIGMLPIFSSFSQVADKLVKSVNSLTDTINPGLVTVTTSPSGTQQPALNSVRKELLKWDVKQIKRLSDTLNTYGFLKKQDSTLYATRSYVNLTYQVKGSYLTATDTLSLSNRINKKLNISDTSSMLSKYLLSSVASSTYQLKGSYLTTELDPTVPSYVKSISSSDITNWNNKISSVKTVNGNSLVGTGNVDIATAPTQYGTTYTKEWNGSVTTTTSGSTYTFNISAAGFSSVTSIQATAYYNGASVTELPIVSVTSVSTSSITVRVVESNTTNILLVSSVEGLTAFEKSGATIYLTVKGN